MPDLTDLHTLKRFLQAHRLTLQTERSQHFLVDPHVRDAMFDAARLTAEDDVVEIGAGVGTLTRALAERAGRVICVEVDRRLIRALQEVLVGRSNVQVVPGNIKKIALGDLVKLFERLPVPGKLARSHVSKFVDQPTRPAKGGASQLANAPTRYKIISSLPYHLTGFLLEKFLTESPRPSIISVLVQKEVAQRIVAKPGEMSTLSVSAQFYGSPRLVRLVPRAAFWPPPEVDSAVVAIEIGKERKPGSREVDERQLFRVVRAGFAGRRKQLHNSLSGNLRLAPEVVHEALTKAQIDPKRRPQDLLVDDWVRLAYNLRKGE